MRTEPNSIISSSQAVAIGVGVFLIALFIEQPLEYSAFPAIVLMATLLRLSLNVATTRRVYHARFHRVGTEKLTLPFREVETEVWEREGGDGNITARVWLAPALHHVMVKMRLSNGRITGEALLDSIRVDDIVATQ